MEHEKEFDEPSEVDRSLGCFARGCCCRHTAKAIVTNSNFEKAVIAAILLSAVQMAIERPGIDPASMERLLLDYFDLGFVSLFSCEMMLKVVADGLYWGPDAYLNNVWNKLDFTLLFFAWLNLGLAMSGVDSQLVRVTRVLRVLRCLRPLRLIQRAPGLKLLMNALSLALAPLGEMAILTFMLFFIYGVMGVQLFGGGMHKCVAKSVNASVAYNVNDKTGCNALLPENEYAWKNSNINFDHIGNALITLFFVSMGDGWVHVMRMATDSRSEEDANP